MGTCNRQTKAVSFAIIMEGVPENALQPLYFVGRNARHGYINTCMQWHPNTCIPDRKATRNHAFRVEISSRACATSGSRISCVSNRKAPRALQFLNEMHDQSNHFLVKHKDSTAISVQNRRTQRLAPTAPQPRPSPPKVAWVRSLNT